jgi:hypothetical protein
MDLLFKSNMGIPSIECPHCKSAGRLKQIARWKHINLLAMLVGGIMLPILWVQGRKTEFYCTDCKTLFATRTFSAKVSYVLFWIAISLLGVMMLLVLLID